MPTSGQILLSKIANNSQWDEELHPEVIIKNLINNLSSNNCQPHEIEILKFLLDENKTDKSVIHNILYELMKKSLGEWKFAKISVELIRHMHETCDDSIKVKDQFIVNLQSTYNVCKENKSKDVNSWIGFVSLLVHSTVQMLLQDKTPIRPLMMKSQECLKCLLDGSASDMEIDCGRHLLDVCWNVMLAHNKDGLKDLVPPIKEIIVAARGSPETRTRFIDMLITLNSEPEKQKPSK